MQTQTRLRLGFEFDPFSQPATCRYAATRGLSSVFFAVHAAEKNDWNIALRAKTIGNCVAEKNDWNIALRAKNLKTALRAK
ncbi:MAG: hypothetical protein LBM18_03765 [Oscillospiraceae bacterium]|jgi:hypothetical protein|nr:hypothetical protein [Oscillospiraceae bacterium]